MTTFQMTLNVGVEQVVSRDATAPMALNVGVEQMVSRDATAAMASNVGVERADLEVVFPQTGWGVPLVPTREVALALGDDADEAYMTVEVT